MSMKATLLSSIVAALASCASAASAHRAHPGLELTATAVEVVPSAEPVPIAASRLTKDELAEIQATAAEYATRRQVLVNAVMRGPEYIQPTFRTWWTRFPPPPGCRQSEAFSWARYRAARSEIL